MSRYEPTPAWVDLITTSAICSEYGLVRNQSENELVIFLQQARRINHVRATDCLQDVGDGYRGHQQFRRVGNNVEFWFLPTLNHNR